MSSSPDAIKMAENHTAFPQPETGDGVLLFAVNGVKFELASIDPSTTLLEFLRSQTPFKSVKLGCGEGGCGACVVMLSKYNSEIDRVESFSMSSCLTLLCSANGCSVTTSEGLGNSKDGFHPIHQRFAGFHASQCGFCTPGMCMSFYSALTNAKTLERPDPPPGFSKLTITEAENAIAGNLCRCTGYRPIADACKSFAANVDLEDLGLNTFWRKGEPEEHKLRSLPLLNPDLHVSKFPDFLKGKIDKTMKLKFGNCCWYSPTSLEELKALLNSNAFNSSRRIKLIVGNTGMGYYKEKECYEKYVDLRHIPELSVIRKGQKEIEIGAAATISRVITYLKDYDTITASSDGKLFLQKIVNHMEKVASGFIRNTGSIGGNLVMAQRKGFPSDIVTILLAVGSNVSIMTGQKHESLTLEDFLASPPMDSTSLLLSIKVPILEPERNGIVAGSSSKLVFETYRAAPRPLGNALPYLNAAFLANVSPHENGILVNSIHLAFGSYGTKHAIRARTVEKYISGNVVSASVLLKAVKLVQEAIIPEYGTSHAAYRRSLASSFLFQFLSPYASDLSANFGGLHGGLSENVQEMSPTNNCNSSNGELANLALLSTGSQQIKPNSEYYPVGKAMTKFGAAIQASGEAVYVDDIPSPLNCLHGAFVYSTKPLARVRGVDFQSNAEPSRVAAVLSYKDIPSGGENVGSKGLLGFEPLFADELTRWTGEPIAFVVAESQKLANYAANCALVNYETKDLDPPILTVEEAVKKSSLFKIPPFLCPQQVGDISKGMAEADLNILSTELKLGSQYYFYMETQTALAVPDEDNCLVVYSSIQCPEIAHSVIAKCLGIPEHNVRVITRRVGGGFGGKMRRAIPVATACALAAHKLRRPVRIYLNRKTDMIMTGGRHPMKITYSVGFKSNGKITALHLDILINAGISADMSPIIPLFLINSLKKYNWGALSFDIKLCKTNHSSKSSMRAPGEVQGSFIAEAIIEHVASTLSIDVDSVRNVNIHTLESLKLFYGESAGEAAEYTLPNIWKNLGGTSSLKQRLELMQQFNRSNIWQKRGISRVPIVYEVRLRPAPAKVSILWDGSIVVEVGGIELGQGLWTKVKQTAAYSLSLLGCSQTENLVEKVRVVQSDTLSLIQGNITAGSTTSESNCEAVRLCCNVLVERLSALKYKLQEQTSQVNWDNLILQAHLQSVNMAAHSYFVPDRTATSYLTYGAAISEVEINTLTGETKILRADIAYDCGKSLNPAVDLGQIEGAFVQGIGFYMLEEYVTNSDGLTLTDGTWTYKIPTIDTIPKQLNVEILNCGEHQNRVLSSKASGEPPLLLAASIHCATRAAIKAAREQLHSWSKGDEPESTFQLDVPAIIPVVKNLCGLDNVERYLESILPVLDTTDN
ncbi:OLC1v1004938C1 [Oldenlandia corymbosa var. corymbosa]|uniref:indole-3-acetaldehyde oxidase n=1 Tax=Oldenlandia corymbosa var. corymbosa TaxID=529605 RepID=A0AAV1DDI0_OLDCO|nr:OLC1v1004938C1 [Oldenlandia corymbosa var. corymbosa]